MNLLLTNLAVYINGPQHCRKRISAGKILTQISFDLDLLKYIFLLWFSYLLTKGNEYYKNQENQNRPYESPYLRYEMRKW